MRFAAVLCTLVLATSCERANTPSPEPEKKGGSGIAAKVGPEPRDNLLELAHGASVVSRTSDLTLDVSAAFAIDGDPLTEWRSAPTEIGRELVFALPAPARVTSIGIHVSDHKWHIPIDTRVDGSLDNTTWRELARIVEPPDGSRAMASIAPATLRYVRLRLLYPEGRQRYYAVLRNVFVKGQLLEPPTMPDVAGCWSINGVEARFEQHGNRVSGIIRSEPPTIISGARDARAMRLMWRRGPQWGHALVTIDPQRKTLSGARWHEEVSFKNVAAAWYGEPSPCSAPLAMTETGIAQQILQRAGRWTAYSDDGLDILAALTKTDTKQRFRIVTRTQERMTQVRNALQTRVDRARVELTMLPPEAAPTNESMRVMADGVELHLLR